MIKVTGTRETCHPRLDDGDSEEGVGTDDACVQSPSIPDCVLA